MDPQRPQVYRGVDALYAGGVQRVLWYRAINNKKGKLMTLLFRISIACLLCLFLTSAVAWADSSKYPQFAALANSLDGNVNPEFIHIDQLVKDILEHKSLTLVDVRPADEYAAQHITGAISVPLQDLAANPALIPKEGFVVLY